jgi:hypothetical protein
VDKEGVRAVNFSPPNSWHLESINEEPDRKGEYRLSSLGRERMTLEIAITTRYKTIGPESMEELAQNLSKDWDKYKAPLEGDYASSRTKAGK